MKSSDAAPATGRQALDKGLAFRAIMGEETPDNELFAVIAERIRLAAARLGLARESLYSIFSRHSIYEGVVAGPPGQALPEFLLVETHHLIQGKVGKGALKIVFPKDLLGESSHFRTAEAGGIEVVPPAGLARWPDAAAAEQMVLRAMREFMTGESLSMSLKCQATGAPFSGSEGLMLCARRDFDAASGRYFLRPVLHNDADHAAADKELVEFMMNSSGERLTRAGRIAHDRIVHAAETNSTLTARLDLQLPTNVVEGHLRALLTSDPHIIIGDEDMTSALWAALRRPDYQPTRCALARLAATMQIGHSILLLSSRERLRQLLLQLPREGSLSAAQYREITDLLFGTGEIQQNEDQLYCQREATLRALSIALTSRSLAECDDPQMLAFYLQTLLDNQHMMMELAILKRLPQGRAMAEDWFERAAPLTAKTQSALAALTPEPGLGAAEVRRRFAEIIARLSAEIARGPKRLRDPYAQARATYLDLALGAITAQGGLVPPADRLLFFLLPFTYECVTPKLGVVTRKPVAVCGSLLRPEAMAVGAVMSIEIQLRAMTQSTHPLKGLKVAVEGLGNAGKNVARILAAKGAVIVGVSDSTGAVMKPAGFTPPELEAIIAHKSAGARLHTLPKAVGAPGADPAARWDFSLYPDPAMLRRMKADILILTAVPGAITEHNAADLDVSLICELTGAAVTSAAKPILKARHIQVVPDNLASSGGLLVSLSEMLQNSAGQNWNRTLEEHNLRQYLEKSFDRVLALAREQDVDVATASDMLALQRMHGLAQYREKLEEMAAALADRILKISEGEYALVSVDNDEDGVASGAILQGLIATLNPGAASRLLYAAESLRSRTLLALIEQHQAQDRPIRQVFLLDRAFPARPSTQAVVIELARQFPGAVTLINNHTLPPELLQEDPTPADNAVRSPADLGLLLISPQTLCATVAARQFPTAMIMKELAHLLVTDASTLAAMDWQAAVGSYLDAPEEMTEEWLLFFTQFNSDKLLAAARAVRMVTRTGGYLSALRALAGVKQPDRLETNESWEHFMAEYRALAERVQVLVEKIALENRRQPFIAHFFTHEEVQSPTPISGNAFQELDFYHWISEHLTQRGNLAEKPIIVGQVVPDSGSQPCLGIRIRSPRGVELMEAGLPESFTTAGLPNTAIARLPLVEGLSPERQFHQLVNDIWMKTTHPIYLGAHNATEGNPLGVRPW